MYRTKRHPTFRPTLHYQFLHGWQVQLINPVPVVGPEDELDRQRRVPHGGVADPVGRVGPGAGVVPLLESDAVRLRLVLGPLGPARPVDVAAQLAALERDAGPVAPGAAQEDAAVLDLGALGGGDHAVGDDVPARVVVVDAPARRDPAVAVAGDGRVGDPGARVLAEDEVGHALDVAVGVELVAHLGQEGVLGAVDAHAVVSLAGVVGGYGDGLVALAPEVADVEVVDRSVGRLVDEGGGPLVIWRNGKGGVVLQGHSVALVAGDVGRLPVDGDLGRLGWQIHLLRVGATIDEDGRRVCGRVGDAVHSR